MKPMRSTPLNEAELILAWSEISGHLWTVIQFWASITFGVIAIGHFAPDHLNQFLVIFLTFLYSLFTLFCGSVFVADTQLLISVYEEARALAAFTRFEKVVKSSTKIYQTLVTLSTTIYLTMALQS